MPVIVTEDIPNARKIIRFICDARECSLWYEVKCASDSRPSDVLPGNAGWKMVKIGEEYGKFKCYCPTHALGLANSIGGIDGIGGMIVEAERSSEIIVLRDQVASLLERVARLELQAERLSMLTPDGLSLSSAGSAGSVGSVGARGHRGDLGGYPRQAGNYHNLGKAER